MFEKKNESITGKPKPVKNDQHNEVFILNFVNVGLLKKWIS